MGNDKMKLTYTRLFSTGNFEHMKIGLEMDTTKEDLGKDFEGLVASAIALKEHGLDMERKFTFDENAKKRIEALKSEIASLQSQLPEG